MQRTRHVIVQPTDPCPGVRAFGPKDVILRANGQHIDEAHPLKNVVLGSKPGDRVTLRIVRDGKPQDLQIALGRPVAALDVA